MKSFEELMVGIDDPGEVEEICTEKEAEKRAEVFLNGYRVAEQRSRRLINDISFRLNNKLAKGCQAKQLIKLYNQSVGRLLDDFIY